MRLPSLIVLLCLGGCASGTILNPGAQPSPNTSTLSAPYGTLLGIKPLHSQGSWTSGPKSGEWALLLNEGWYLIEFSCNEIRENGVVTQIRIDESGTRRSIKIGPGRTYRLECDSRKVGLIHLRNLGVASNQPLHPDASRASALSAGERRR